MVTTRSATGSTGSTTTFVRLSVGTLTIGLEMQRVMGIERADRLRPFPERPEFVGRIVNRAGEWPVLNLADRLDLQHTPNTRTGQIVLTELAGEQYGLLVDRVNPVQRLDSSAQKTIPRSAGGRGTLFDGVMMLESGPVLVLNPDRLTGAESNDLANVESVSKPSATRTKRIALDRMLVVGQFEYPLPGGRPVGFGLPVGSVVEITELPVGTPIPGGESHVVELSHWRDEPLPIVSLAAWCGVRSPVLTSRRAVVMGTPSGERIGVLAGDHVKMIAASEPHLPLRRALTFNQTRVAGAFEFNEITVLLPDVSKLR